MVQGDGAPWAVLEGIVSTENEEEEEDAEDVMDTFLQGIRALVR